jgi:hypothetical protein
MKQEMRIGLDLGRLAVLKKKRVWADYEQLLRVFFSCFQGQKSMLIFFSFKKLKTIFFLIFLG